jgi:O-antigen ligase
MLQITDVRRDDVAWIALGLFAVLASTILVSRFGSSAGVILLALVVVAPALVLIDGAPLWFLMAILPVATLFNGSSVGVGGLKAATLIALPCWLLGIILHRQTVRIHFCSLDYAVLGLFVVALINILLLSLPSAAPNNLIQQYGGDLILYFLVRWSITSARSLRIALSAFVAGSLPALTIALWRFANGQTLASENISRLQLPSTNTNAFASTMLVTAAISFGFGLYESRPQLRVFWWTMVGLASLAVILSFSREAFIGALAMVVFGAALSRQSRVRLASLGIVLFGLLASRSAVAEPLGLSPYVSRISSILSGSSSPFRRILWAMGWRAFRSHLLFGLGVGNFQLPQFWYPLASQEIVTAGFLAAPLAVHNFYLGWAVDAGVPGVIFLGATMLIALGYSIRMVWNRTSLDGLSAMTLAITLGFVGYFASLTFAPSQKDQLPYMLVALVASLWGISSGRLGTVGLERSVSAIGSHGIFEAPQSGPASHLRSGDYG